MTGSKSRQPVSGEDLIYRARVGQLTDAEHQELVQALETSSSLRIAYQLGRDFDAVDCVLPGDDLLIARASENVVRRGNRSLAGRAIDTFSSIVRRPKARVAATLLLAASAAAAVAIGTGRLHFGTHLSTQGTPSATASAIIVPRTHAVAPADTHAAVPEDLKDSKSVEGVPSSHAGSQGGQLAPDKGSALVASPSVSGGRTNVTSKNGGDKTEGAESLFRHANEARRNGQLAQAIALYTNLQTRYADTTEAKLSHISLAKLLLASGRASEADAQFVRYLALGGPLDLEALVGRAECQRLLGHAAEERVIWRQVLERFPSSVHAVRARQRLAALGDVAQ